MENTPVLVIVPAVTNQYKNRYLYDNIIFLNSRNKKKIIL